MLFRVFKRNSHLFKLTNKLVQKRVSHQDVFVFQMLACHQLVAGTWWQHFEQLQEPADICGLSLVQEGLCVCHTGASIPSWCVWVLTEHILHDSVGEAASSWVRPRGPPMVPRKRPHLAAWGMCPSRKFSLLSKNLKIKIYKTIMLPVVLYGCEAWSVTLNQTRVIWKQDPQANIWPQERWEWGVEKGPQWGI